MSTAPLRLHGYWRSSASWRVRIALAHKGVAYEYVPVHLVRGGGEHRGAAYRALNPMAQVPTLELPSGAALAQSVAILEYLEEAHPLPALLPTDPLARAQVRQLVEVVNSAIHPLQNLGTLQELGARFGAERPATLAWAAHWIARGFAGLEVLLGARAGCHAVGDDVTLADVLIVPQVYNARRFGVDLQPFPRIRAVDAAAMALDAFQTSSPERQPDATAGA